MAELVLPKEEIGQFVSFKDQGEITHLLGIEVIRNRSARTISFSRRHYIDTMLTTYRLDNARLVSTPAHPHLMRLSTSPLPECSRRSQSLRHHDSSRYLARRPKGITPTLAGVAHWTVVKHFVLPKRHTGLCPHAQCFH